MREYFERKEQEIALLDRCLYRPLHPILPKSVSEAIELKFRLAALLKAGQLIKRWSITETSRKPASWGNAGPFAFNFGYQRADLEVRGPPIYARLDGLCSGCRTSTIYVGSGMSAIAALVVATLQLRDRIDVVAAVDCYVEARELLTSFGSRIRIVPLSTHLSIAANKTPTARILWLNSSVRRSMPSAGITAPRSGTILVGVHNER